jgi:hypothetical protein
VADIVDGVDLRLEGPDEAVGAEEFEDALQGIMSARSGEHAEVIRLA